MRDCSYVDVLADIVKGFRGDETVVKNELLGGAMEEGVETETDFVDDDGNRECGEGGECGENETGAAFLPGEDDGENDQGSEIYEKRGWDF